MSCLDLSHGASFDLPGLELVLDKTDLSNCKLIVWKNGISVPPPICLNGMISELRVVEVNGIKKLQMSRVEKLFSEPYLFELGLHCTDLRIVDGVGIGVADIRDNFRKGKGVRFDLEKARLRIVQAKNGALHVLILSFESKNLVEEFQSQQCA